MGTEWKSNNKLSLSIIVFILVFSVTQISFAQLAEQISGVTIDLNDIFFIDELTGWAVGDSGTIIHTIDGGETWTIQETPTDSSLYRVEFTDSNTGYSISRKYRGTSVILSTKDGGSNWTSQVLGDSIELRGMYFLNSDTGWVCGRKDTLIDSNLGHSLIYKTTDGGNNWEKIDQVFGGSYVNDLVFTDINNGWIFETSYMDNFNTSTVKRTYDGGSTWIRVGETTAATYNMKIVTPDTIWASGFYSHEVSVDGGVTWTSFSRGHDIAPISGTEAWFISFWRFCFTEDIGNSYQIIHSGIPVILSSISTFEKNRVWVAGNNGYIAHYNKDLVTSIEDTDNLPDRFELNQNFPNPFNPVTTIRYQLPEAVDVTIVVYNIMGQEVAQLVNTPIQAGSHSVKWDASRFASGTYLYKITAGSFTATKRMVVIK